MLHFCTVFQCSRANAGSRSIVGSHPKDKTEVASTLCHRQIDQPSFVYTADEIFHMYVISELFSVSHSRVDSVDKKNLM